MELPGPIAKIFDHRGPMAATPGQAIAGRQPGSYRAATGSQ